MRASFPRAIAWLAWTDDCAWVYDDDWVAPVTAILVAELFGKEVAYVRLKVWEFRRQQGLADA